MPTIPVPGSAAEATDMVLSDLKYLATTDPTTLAAQVQAECLQAFEQADAISTAARAGSWPRSPPARATPPTRITAPPRG